MKTHHQRLEASDGKKRQAVNTSMRQTRQASSVTSDEPKKLTLRKSKALRSMILDIKERRKVGYRWFERFGNHCFGWYQHIGSGNFKQVHATEQDYQSVKRIYDLLKEDALIDAQLLTLLLDLIEVDGKRNEIIRDVIAIARRNTK